MRQWTNDMERLLGELHVGKINAIPARILAKKMHLKQNEPYKTIQRIVRQLVMDGIPISGCVNGFYLIDSKDEYMETIEYLKDRIEKLKIRVRKLKGFMAMANKSSGSRKK